MSEHVPLSREQVGVHVTVKEPRTLRMKSIWKFKLFINYSLKH